MTIAPRFEGWVHRPSKVGDIDGASNTVDVVRSVAPAKMATKSILLIVHRTLDVKNWLLRPPKVQEARSGRWPRCHCASQPTGGPLGMHGHGQRDRQVLGPLAIGLAATRSVVAAVAYSPEAALDIEFTSGAKYRYFAVPAQLFHEFLSADSKGVFFNRRIRPYYPGTKLDP